MKHTLEQCKGYHCKCMRSDCTNYHFIDCELNKAEQEPHTNKDQGGVEEIARELGQDIISAIREFRDNGQPILWLDKVILKHLVSLEQAHHQELQKAREEERERIEAIFKEHVPPHAMDLEDSVWLKRLLNKAFNHDKNI